MADVQHAALADAELHTAYPNGTDAAATYDATPDVGDWYFETDTGILSYCYVDNTWVTVAVYPITGELLLQTAYRNTATQDSAGWLEGCWIERNSADNTQLFIHPGTVAIANKLYQETSVLTVDIDTGYDKAAGTSGVDSSTTIQNANWYYVILTTDPNDPDGFIVNINDDATPAECTLGTDARCIGRFYYLDGTTKVQLVYNYRPEGVYGWNYIIGDDAGQCGATDVAFGVTFDRYPYMTASAIGSLGVATPPTDVNQFASEANNASLYGITTTNFDINIWFVSNGNSSSGFNYAYTFFAPGSWTM